MAAYHCCVPMCTNDSRYNTKDVSFHSFPADDARRKEWIVKVRRDEGQHFQIKAHTKVCSVHFKNEYFMKTLTGKKCLVKNAVPTTFSWTMDNPLRKPPMKRQRLEDSNMSIDDTDIEPSPLTHTIVTPQPMFHDYLQNEKSENEKLEEACAHIDELEQKIEKMSMNSFGLERFSTDPQMLLFYTGFSSYSLLINLFNLLKPSAERMTRWTQIQRQRYIGSDVIQPSFRIESLSLIDQCFIFLVKVRLGLFQQDLAVRCNISQATVSRIIITWSNFLYFQLGSLPIWPSREQIDRHMPECFKEMYPSTRVILDCTEIKIQTPSSLSLNSEFYSHYKSATTFKSLIGISPSGCIIFVSSLFAGSISDKEITRQSNIVSLLEEGDSVMADKGFLIQDLLDAKGAKLNIPPFLTCNRNQFTTEEVEETQEIARLRIHVERAIRRIKEYHIFDSVIPISLAGSATQLWTVCCLMTLFKGPLF